jgi:hypothetical protein
MGRMELFRSNFGLEDFAVKENVFKKLLEVEEYDLVGCNAV